MKSDFCEIPRTPIFASARVAIRIGLVASGMLWLSLAAAQAQATSGGDTAVAAPAVTATEPPSAASVPPAVTAPAVTAAPKVEAAPAAAAAAPALPAVKQRAASAAPATTAARLKPVRKTASPAGSEATSASASMVTTGSVAKTAAVAGAQAAGKPSGRCTRMAFEVNDYGKDGPTKDAMQLLDVHVAKWAAEKNIKKYTIGKKVVNCRLFLDFGVFDEHTCRAEAPVCW